MWWVYLNRKTNMSIESGFSVWYIFLCVLNKNLLYWNIYTPMASLLLDQRGLNIIPYVKAWFWAFVPLTPLLLFPSGRLIEACWKKKGVFLVKIYYVELCHIEPRWKYCRSHLNSSPTDSISSINYFASKKTIFMLLRKYSYIMFYRQTTWLQ